MANINMPKPLLYFVIPFLILAGWMIWTSFRISRPDEALENARKYLEEKVPGARWQVGKTAKVGEGLNKKWRIELSASKKDGRMAQANLLVDRWRPGRLAGKFVMLFGPPQILDGGWENPSLLDSLSPKIPLNAYLYGGALCLGLQCFWLFWVRRRRTVLPRDGILLAILGFGALWSQVVMEVEPGYLAGYALAILLIVWVVFSGNGVKAGAGKE
jgi:hypothetical protein